MKWLLTLALSTIALAVAYGQALPHETEADRKPRTVTHGSCYIRAGMILTVTRGTIRNGVLIVRGGKIAYVGPAAGAPAPGNLPVIDASTEVIMPGIVDAHVHRGIDDTNEGTEALSAEVRIADSINPEARSWWHALASGQTTALALHGSANPIGGQCAVIKFKYRSPIHEVLVKDAPRQIKFALGENVTRMNSPAPANPAFARFLATRMGVEAVYRRAFEAARQYMAEWQRWERSDRSGVPPRRDLRLETVADILRGRIWVQCHSYRADEILMMARLSREFNFKIGSMQHALEAYKVAPELAALGTPVSMFMDHWSFKLEGSDAIPTGAAICHKAGVLTSVNTDGVSGTTALIYDAAKLIREGGLTVDEALATVTLNPAKQLGVDRRVGSLEVGKDADIAFYDGHPFAVASKVTRTMIEGEVRFERRDAYGVGRSARASFELPTPDPHVPARPRIGTTYAIVGGTVHPVSRPPIPNATLILRDGRVAAVGQNLPIPSGAIIVSARGNQVYPGMIDAGTSMGLSEISGIRQTNDLTDLGDFQPDLRAGVAIQNASAHFGPALTNGLLHVVSRPAGGLVPGQASLLSTWGWTSEAQNRVPNLALVVNVPSAPPPIVADPSLGDACACVGITLQDFIEGVADQHMLAHVEREDDALSEMLQGGPQRPAEGSPDQEQVFAGRMRLINEYFERAAKYSTDRSTKPAETLVDLSLEAMRPVLRGERLVLLRCRQRGSILNAIALAKKFNLRAVLVGAAEAMLVAKEVKESKIPLLIVPAGRVVLGANVPIRDFDPYDQPYAFPLQLIREGIPFAFMSEENAMSMNLPTRVGMHLAYGLTPEQAVRALTLGTAEILGLSREMGSLDTGKRADVIITNGMPLESTTKVLYAWIGGRPITLESKHTLLRDRYLRRLNPAEK